MPHPRPLIRGSLIRARCRQLGREIAAAYPNRQVMMLVVLDGAFVFAADLVRAIPLPDVEVRCVRASSYLGQHSSGTVALGDLPDVSERVVLVVEDILDTGRTLSRLGSALLAAGASEVASVVLLDKPSRRIEPVSADYVGFTIPDRFVVGYGLDHDGQHRHLPDVCVLDADS